MNYPNQNTMNVGFSFSAPAPANGPNLGGIGQHHGHQTGANFGGLGRQPIPCVPVNPVQHGCAALCSSKPDSPAKKAKKARTKQEARRGPKETEKKRKVATSKPKAPAAGAQQSDPDHLTCHRCKCIIGGPNASKELDKHLKDCGSIACVLCGNKYKSVKTLQAHQIKAHV